MTTATTTPDRSDYDIAREIGRSFAQEIVAAGWPKSKGITDSDELLNRLAAVGISASRDDGTRIHYECMRDFYLVLGQDN